MNKNIENQVKSDLEIRIIKSIKQIKIIKKNIVFLNDSKKCNPIDFVHVYQGCDSTILFIQRTNIDHHQLYSAMRNLIELITRDRNKSLVIKSSKSISKIRSIIKPPKFTWDKFTQN